MNRLSIVAALLAVSAAMSGCGWLVGEWAGAASKPVERLTFSHKKHVVDEEVACTECHGDMSESVSLQSKRQMPKEAACTECHDRKDDCKKCHTNPKAPLRWIDTRMNGIRFSHKTHMARTAPASAKVDGKKTGAKKADGKKADGKQAAATAAAKVTCATCHANISTATRTGHDQRPEMFKVCGQCHQKDFDRDGCQRCHANLVENEQRPLSMFQHAGNWLARHGTAAHGAAQVCAHCHTETSCAECHARTNAIVARPSLLRPTAVGRATHHRGDWMSRHGIESRQKPTSCMTCHQEPRCTGCHKSMKVSALNPGGPSRHPPGWMIRGSAQFHGTEARRAPLGCAVCHDRGAASNCVTCHRVGATGGNPHPPGWRSDQNKHSAAACAPCHL